MSVVINGSAGVTTNSGAVYNGISAGTAVASTSGTSIDFTSIPSWVKRITVMLQGVSTNGTSNPIVQIGTGGTPTTSGYTGAGGLIGVGTVSYTAGFGFDSASAVNIIISTLTITQVSGNLWQASYAGTLNQSGTNYPIVGSGYVTLSGTLNMVRVTTINGTDTFDAGSINILYE